MTPIQKLRAALQEIYASIDYTRPDKENARKLGVSVSTIVYHRLRRGIRHNRGGLGRPQIMPDEEWRALDWSWCDPYLAKKLKLEYSTVRMNRIRLGIPRGTKGDIRTSEAFKKKKRKVHLKKSDFKEKDIVIARRLGISRERVRQLRKKMGLPSSRTID